VARLQFLAGTDAEVHITTRDVPAGIKRTLRRLDADLLVIGPGRNSARSDMLGSNVTRLVGAAPCPVVVLEKITTGPQPNKDMRVAQSLRRPAGGSRYAR
jgi:nucleotide-binding universal stress UspA family protein